MNSIWQEYNGYSSSTTRTKLK
uniref:Uncharacterized protein n=1 Tax=Anguilla anguilla TaxID=7936 RepID=A0A0E9UP60_ANGAN